MNVNSPAPQSTWPAPNAQAPAGSIAHALATNPEAFKLGYLEATARNALLELSDILRDLPQRASNDPARKRLLKLERELSGSLAEVASRG